jgi:hypothetical protein
MRKAFRLLSLTALLTTAGAAVSMAATGEGTNASGTPQTVGVQTGSQQANTPPAGSAVPATPGTPAYSYPKSGTTGLSAQSNGEPPGASPTQPGAPPSHGGETGGGQGNSGSGNGSTGSR